ncbi:aminodeoxychorismate synthase component 1 [bacterium BMS3Abin04]|nr:aminodeoxychorismate synthase component 1 [bacterium BMS3Abin04]
MIRITEILDFIEGNTNSAFFYTPNIYENPTSYFLKIPKVVLEAANKESIERILREADILSKKDNLVGMALIPYEIGYYFQPANVYSHFPLENINSKLRLLFYDKKNIEIINSNMINFSDSERFLTNENKTRNYILNTGKQEYVKSVEKIKNYIANGDCYQVNYTTKLKFHLEHKDLTGFFLKGIFNQSSKYSAFINLDDNFILSFSPELFFETDFKIVQSKPMKGTLKRAPNKLDDDLLVQRLRNDEKNISENVMIVDLLRNDIGKISKINSVNVPKLFEIEKYETLFQMTSTVQGKLKDTHLSNIIKNLFPCGSITGAPKIKTMEIISQLEKEPRGIYTGVIGLITNKKTTFNIAIRTLTVDKGSGKSEFGLGSGIVWDSDTKDEYKEVLLKGKFITEPKKYFELLESILFEDGVYFLLNLHLQRLQYSSDYFLFKFDKKKIVSTLIKLSKSLLSNKKYKVRLSLSKWGNVNVGFEEIFSNNKKVKILLVKRKNIAEKQFYNFKTTYRTWDIDYKTAKANGYYDIVFYNDEEQLLESAVGNVLFTVNNKIFTPPLELNILNGCYRQQIISKRKVLEQTMTISDIESAGEIIICNSVRKEIIVDEIYDSNSNLIYLK